MTEEFCARFEADCAPEWYLCAWGWGLHGPAHMGRAMHEGFNTAIREAYAAQAHSSGSGGGSSSGGGFSSRQLRRRRRRRMVMRRTVRSVRFGRIERR